MDDPDIIMVEYIQLEAEKARRRGQEFNWETSTYGKVRYFKDINYFKDFENEFPSIVYKDALTSEPKISSEPTISARHVKKVDYDFKISFDESNDEDYTFTYDKNSFSYKLISLNDLELDLGNDDDKIDIKQSSGDISIEPLPNVISLVLLSLVWTLLILLGSKEMATDGLRAYWADSLREIATNADLRDYWSRISSDGEVRHLRRHAEGEAKGGGPRMSGGHFVARLAKHFRLITEERLRGLTVVVRVDIDELADHEILEEGIQVDPAPAQAP
ncbi:hypothetical protein Tco_0954325 [Tanacetum coccineum]|uniref:Uncharacterized protein n=1 Tax=Tanacetum coccineum TaxID=301880 RepID=A0ABQ5E2F6_9ASTR